LRKSHLLSPGLEYHLVSALFSGFAVSWFLPPSENSGRPWRWKKRVGSLKSRIRVLYGAVPNPRNASMEEPIITSLSFFPSTPSPPDSNQCNRSLPPSRYFIYTVKLIFSLEFPPREFSAVLLPVQESSPCKDFLFPWSSWGLKPLRSI